MIFLDGMKMERKVIALSHEDPVDLPLAQPSRLGQQFLIPVTNEIKDHLAGA